MSLNYLNLFYNIFQLVPFVFLSAIWVKFAANRKHTHTHTRHKLILFILYYSIHSAAHPKQFIFIYNLLPVVR